METDKLEVHATEPPAEDHELAEVQKSSLSMDTGGRECLSRSRLNQDGEAGRDTGTAVASKEQTVASQAEGTSCIAPNSLSEPGMSLAVQERHTLVILQGDEERCLEGNCGSLQTETMHSTGRAVLRIFAAQVAASVLRLQNHQVARMMYGAWHGA